MSRLERLTRAAGARDDGVWIAGFLAPWRQASSILRVWNIPRSRSAQPPHPSLLRNDTFPREGRRARVPFSVDVNPLPDLGEQHAGVADVPRSFAAFDRRGRRQRLTLRYRARMNATRFCFSGVVSLSPRTRLKNSTVSSSVSRRWSCM